MRSSATPLSQANEPIEETIGYVPSRGEQIYWASHRPTEPVAQAILAGPFASERPHSYAAWAGWARFLARNGFEVIRFDYRGTGESTGDFEQMTFADWAEDVRFVADWALSRAPSLPLVLHGLGLGALLSAHAFASGRGRRLLMWGAPANGRDVLKEGLMRRLSMDFVLQAGGPRPSFNDYVARIDGGEHLEVEGYRWTRALWHGAGEFDLHAMLGGTGTSGECDGRAWRSVKLDRSKVPLVSGLGSWQALNPRATVGKVPLHPDFSEFFSENTAWLSSPGGSAIEGHR